MAGPASTTGGHCERCAGGEVPARRQDGVSHLNYLRNNILLTWMHIRLMLGWLLRLPFLVLRRLNTHRSNTP
jgi:hypothetical protein